MQETIKRVGAWLRKQGRRLKVIATAAPTWLTAAGATITYFNEEIVSLLPEAWQSDATALGVAALGVVTAAARIIRRVTPVEPEERGILPVDQPPPLPEGI